MDSRIEEHARILIDYSIEASEGDSVMIFAGEKSKPLLKAIHKKLGKIGATPYVVWGHDDAIQYELLNNWNKDADFESPDPILAMMDECDSYISIEAPENKQSMNNLSNDIVDEYNTARSEIITKQVNEMNWVVTNHPTDAFAQLANMSTEEYKNMFYNAVIRDWEEQRKYQEQLVDLLSDSTEIKLVSGNDTDICFEVGVVGTAHGKVNMPCGESYITPYWDTLNGHISFDFPTMINNKIVSGICLEFEDGELIDYSAEQNEHVLTKLLDTDDGASRIGEVGFGMNKGITESTTEILLDEKISGTVNLALGFAYDDGERFNDSSIHKDIIIDMREDSYITADDKTIFENGKYIFDN